MKCCLQMSLTWHCSKGRQHGDLGADIDLHEVFYIYGCIWLLSTNGRKTNGLYNIFNRSLGTTKQDSNIFDY